MPELGQSIVCIMKASEIVTGGLNTCFRGSSNSLSCPSPGLIDDSKWLVFIASHISLELCVFQDIYRKPTILLTQTRLELENLPAVHGQRLIPIALPYFSLYSRRTYHDKISCRTGALRFGLFRDTKPDNKDSYLLDTSLLSVEHSIHFLILPVIQLISR